MVVSKCVCTRKERNNCVDAISYPDVMQLNAKKEGCGSRFLDSPVHGSSLRNKLSISCYPSLSVCAHFTSILPVLLQNFLISRQI